MNRQDVSQELAPGRLCSQGAQAMLAPGVRPLVAYISLGQARPAERIRAGKRRVLYA